MNVPAAPPPFPGSGWPTFGACAVGAAAVACFALGHGRSLPLAAGAALVVLAALLVWLAIARNSARGTWAGQIAKFSLRQVPVGPAALGDVGAGHPVLEQSEDHGVEQILRGRIQDRDVVLVQAYREIRPGPFVTVFAAIGTLFAIAGAFAGASVGDTSPGRVRKYTTVLLVPIPSPAPSGERMLGEWTLTSTPTSTAIYVADRDLEPSQLEVFVGAALRVLEVGRAEAGTTRK